MWSRFLVVCLLLLPNAAYVSQPTGKGMPDYTLKVYLDIRASKMYGVATIQVKKGQEIKLDKGRLNLLSVSLDKQKIAISYQDKTVRILSSREGKIEIEYEGIFRDHHHPYEIAGEQNSSVIGGKGILLTGAWYPKPDQMCTYHLTVTLPDDYEAVSEAETIEKTTRDGKRIFAFTFPHPIDGINLIATDRYKIVKDHFNGVEIFAYFFAEDIDLVKTYIEHTKKYLKLYENLISKFPYKRFSIVENFLPTGYSMPTYTLLGQEIVRLPFIPETSLGHEILHQWFGNLVYIDYGRGNWAEGLTTFLADHLYEEEKGRDSEYRKGTLIDYQSYVNNKNEFPLKDFETRMDYASKAIGYGKALMVFQMLKKLVGEECFYESIRYLWRRHLRIWWKTFELPKPKYWSYNTTFPLAIILGSLVAPNHDDKSKPASFLEEL